MNLQFAVVLSCTDTVCQLESLDKRRIVDARYAAPLVHSNIQIEPGQLVALDTGAAPPEVVYRWQEITAQRRDAGYVLFSEGQPLPVEQLRETAFPQVRGMYRELEPLRHLTPRQIVAQGYDRVAEQHLEWAQQVRREERTRYTTLVCDSLPHGAAVLDLGCGAGVPTSQQLASRFRVTGVDISPRHVDLARQHVPTATFILADMTQIYFSPDSFDGIVAFYSLIHVPRAEQAELLRAVASWLRPGGLLVASMGARSTPCGFEANWLGAPMYWSHFDTETNKRMVREAGLRIEQATEETASEFDVDVTFLWIVARKAGAQ